jgi:hypothetical protein
LDCRTTRAWTSYRRNWSSGSSWYFDVEWKTLTCVCRLGNFHFSPCKTER